MLAEQLDLALEAVAEPSIQPRVSFEALNLARLGLEGRQDNLNLGDSTQNEILVRRSPRPEL
jgi:hypothetical protein